MQHLAIPPVVMTFSAIDPTGGSGIQADIQTLLTLGCHCTPVVTAITAQDTCECKDWYSTRPGLLIEQARVILEDIPVAAFKIGALGSIENVTAIHTMLTDYPDVPVVFNAASDPIGRNQTIDEEFVRAVMTLLAPLVTIMTVETLIAPVLTKGADDLTACAEQMMDTGCEYVLLVDSHSTLPFVRSQLFGHHRQLEICERPRLQERFHGSSCLLSASIAGLLAQQVELVSAVHEAQEYTWKCLENAYRLGMGSHLPNHMFWLHENQKKTEGTSGE